MKLPRVMIAAPKSGSGKTIITCGLLEALKARGIDVCSYKCGPDYIDPMFHRSVIGIPAGNLDSFFSTDNEIRDMMSRCRSEAAVIEGVMGIYDGISGMGNRGSCYDVACASDTAIILIIDVKGMGQTMLSIIKGILTDDTNKLVRGIALNRISAHYYSVISPDVIELLKQISTEREVPVKLLGGIPSSKDIKLESRHLGLLMPGETEGLTDQVREAARLIEDNLDIDAILEIMSFSGELPDNEADCYKQDLKNAPVLAVARDEAFCFYYEENLRELRNAGIRIKEFSPLHDSNIPEEADGLLLGGGYPELHAAELSANNKMMESIKDAISSGMPSLAECGGFMYLLDELEDKDGHTYPMAGAIEGKSYWAGSLKRFGYVYITGNTNDSLLSGRCMKGHEFHYFDSNNNGTDAVAEKPGPGRSWECVHAGNDHIIGYPHLWYPSCPEIVADLKERMQSYRDAKPRQKDK